MRVGKIFPIPGVSAVVYKSLAFPRSPTHIDTMRLVNDQSPHLPIIVASLDSVLVLGVPEEKRFRRNIKKADIGVAEPKFREDLVVSLVARGRCQELTSATCTSDVSAHAIIAGTFLSTSALTWSCIRAVSLARCFSEPKDRLTLERGDDQGDPVVEGDCRDLEAESTSSVADDTEGRDPRRAVVLTTCRYQSEQQRGHRGP
jgi:hypothetical protein